MTTHTDRLKHVAYFHMNGLAVGICMIVMCVLFRYTTWAINPPETQFIVALTWMMLCNIGIFTFAYKYDEWWTLALLILAQGLGVFFQTIVCYLYVLAFNLDIQYKLFVTLLCCFLVYITRSVPVQFYLFHIGVDAATGALLTTKQRLLKSIGGAFIMCLLTILHFGLFFTTFWLQRFITTVEWYTRISVLGIGIPIARVIIKRWLHPILENKFVKTNPQYAFRLLRSIEIMYSLPNRLLVLQSPVFWEFVLEVVCQMSFELLARVAQHSFDRKLSKSRASVYAVGRSRNKSTDSVQSYLTRPSLVSPNRISITAGMLRVSPIRLSTINIPSTVVELPLGDKRLSNAHKLTIQVSTDELECDRMHTPRTIVSVPILPQFFPPDVANVTPSIRPRSLSLQNNYFVDETLPNTRTASPFTDSRGISSRKMTAPAAYEAVPVEFFQDQMTMGRASSGTPELMMQPSVQYTPERVKEVKEPTPGANVRMISTPTSPSIRRSLRTPTTHGPMQFSIGDRYQHEVAMRSVSDIMGQHIALYLSVVMYCVLGSVDTTVNLSTGNIIGRLFVIVCIDFITIFVVLVVQSKYKVDCTSIPLNMQWDAVVQVLFAATTVVFGYITVQASVSMGATFVFVYLQV